jgi:hypothetical protein
VKGECEIGFGDLWIIVFMSKSVFFPSYWREVDPKRPDSECEEAEWVDPSKIGR